MGKLTETEIITHRITNMEIEEQKVFLATIAKGFKPEPITPAMDNTDHWWFNKLSCNGLTKRDGEWPREISLKELVDDFLETSGSSASRNGAARLISKMMKKLCPTARTIRRQSSGVRETWYVLPDQKTAREWFSKVY